MLAGVYGRVKYYETFTKGVMGKRMTGDFKGGVPFDSSFRSFWRNGYKSREPVFEGLAPSSGGQTIKSSIASEPKKQET